MPPLPFDGRMELWFRDREPTEQDRDTLIQLIAMIFVKDQGLWPGPLSAEVTIDDGSGGERPGLHVRCWRNVLNWLANRLEFLLHLRIVPPGFAEEHPWIQELNEQIWMDKRFEIARPRFKALSSATILINVWGEVTTRPNPGANS